MKKTVGDTKWECEICICKYPLYPCPRSKKHACVNGCSVWPDDATIGVKIIIAELKGVRADYALGNKCKITRKFNQALDGTGSYPRDSLYVLAGHDFTANVRIDYFSELCRVASNLSLIGKIKRILVKATDIGFEFEFFGSDPDDVARIRATKVKPHTKGFELSK